MKKLSLMTLVVVLSACKSEQIDGEAIHARVLLTPAVSATCVLFEVRDPSTHSVLDKRWLTRTDDDLQIAVFRGALPETVELAARPFRDGDCQGGLEAKTPNGAFQTVAATFVKGAVPPVTELQLRPGTDGDTDGYVGTDAGGADCKDLDVTVNPGAQETCELQVDLNCDGKKGCEASTCSLTACKGPAATLVMGVPSSPVTAGTCSSGSVSVKDANGTNTRVSASTAVSLEAPSGGVLFFSDSNCTTPAASVTLTGSEDSTPFFFQGQIAGTVTLRASATGLTTVNQSVQILPGAGNRLVFLSTPRTAVARSCSQVVQFQSQDALGNPAQVTAATQVMLQASATGFKFYSDTGCTNEVASVTLAAGTSTGSFYFKGTQAGPVNVTLTATGFTGSQQTETITAGPPSAMVFTGPATLSAGDCSGLVTVTLRDLDGNAATATSATTVSLTPNNVPELTFSTSTGCSPTVTSVQIASGSGSATFRYRSTKSGTFSIGGTSGSLTSTPLSVTVNPGAASVLAFTTNPQTVTAGNCSAVATVQLRDSLGNAVSVPSDTAVTLTANPPGGFQFFTDSSCTGSAVASTTIPGGSSNASFYFKGTVSGAVVMGAAQGSISVNQNATINPGSPTVLAFSQPSLTVAAGDCTAVTLFSTDTFGNRSNVSGNQVVTLTPSAPSLTFSTASNCGSSTGTVTISGGSSSVSFFAKATLVGSVSATASRSGFTSGTLTVTVNPGAPAKLAFTTTAQTLELNTCSAITTVQVRDSSDNVSPVSASTQINLTASPSGNITFYLNSDCTGPTTSITIPASQSSGSFYFKDTVAEVVAISVANANLTGASQDQTITPLRPTALVFTTSPKTLVAGNCSGTVTVEAQAQGSATTVPSPTPVDLLAAPSSGFSFYASTNCSGSPTSQVSIGSSQSTVSFSFKGNTAGTIGVTASNPTIATPATQTATINAAAPTKLVFSTPGHTTVAGICSVAVTVQSRDPFDNPSAVTVDKTLSLNQAGSPTDSNFRFYSDAACANEVTGGSPLILSNGQLAASFYYKGQTARNVDLAVSTAGLTATPVQSHIVTAAAATKVVFSSSTPAQTLLASTCALRTIVRQDTFNNPAADASSLDVALSASAAAEFFLDSGCTTSTSQVTIAAGNSTANFYFKGLSGGVNATAPLTLTATPSGLTAGTQLETIIPTVRTGSCTMAANSKTATCTVTPALGDTSKVLNVFQATTLNQTSDLANVRCFLPSSSPFNVQCERGGSGGSNAVNIRWATAEFPSGVAVQRQAVACVGDTSTATFSAVTQDHSFLLLSSEKDTADQRQTIPRLGVLTSTTQAEIRKTAGAGCGGGAETNSFQVVDYSSATVQRGLASLASTVASGQVNLSPSVPLDRSILLYSYIFDSTTTKICDRLVRGEFTNSGSKVTFSRGDGDTSANCTTPQINSISWEAVTFPTGTVVQQVTKALAAGTASANVTLQTPVDPTRTIVIGGGQWASGQLHGESRNSANENISEGRALAYLADGSTLTIARETSADSATFTVYVVQLKP